MGFDGSSIDRVLSGAVETGVLHGVVAMILDRDGVLYEGAAGEASADTLFRNASMTKAPATTAALQLLERGELELDATVESVLPELADLQVLDGFDGEEAILRPAASQPTIRQLMTHTAGFGYFFTNASLLRYYELTGLASPLEGTRASLTAPLVNDPGTVWEYGVNTDWLGLIVERVSGRTLSSYLAEHVYGPLGMVDSTFAPSGAQRRRLLPIRMRAPGGGLAATELDLPAEPEWDAAGHGSYGTARDYGRFVRMWLRGGELDGERVIGEDTVELALSDHIEGIAMPEIIRSAVPELSNDVTVLPIPQGWGLGFHLVKVDIPGMRSAGTGDWSGVFNTYYWIDRAAGIGGVFMTQILPFFDAGVVQTALGFEAAAYAALGAKQATPSAA